MSSRDRAPIRNDESSQSGSFRSRRERTDQIMFFTISQVAENLCVAKRTVHRWIQAGDLVGHRVGGVVRIAEMDLRAFLALHREA
jgi:excisionase family DNA binding protein